MGSNGKSVGGLRQRWRRTALHTDYVRFKRLRNRKGKQLRYLLPGKIWLDSISVVVTTKCNLRCEACSNLMPLYRQPYDVDHDLMLKSIQKLGACTDWVDDYKILGGEPFCNPRLKEYIAAVPREKCDKLLIITNGTIIPQDPGLYETMRRQRATVYFSAYPAAKETQERFIELLKEKGVDYTVSTNTGWIDYGKPESHGRTQEELKRQFLRCNIPCKLLLNGAVYYCPRSAHGYDLGLYERGGAEYVDLMANSDAQNRRLLYKLMWRHDPIIACQYCQNGTDACVKISRGK